MQILQKKGASNDFTWCTIVILLKQVTFFILFNFARISAASKGHQLYPDWQRVVAGQ